MSYNFSNTDKEKTPTEQNQGQLEQSQGQPWTPYPPVAQKTQAAQGDTPTYTYPMKRTPGTVQGANSRFRDGNITLNKEGIIVEGQAVLPPEYQWLILVGIAMGIGWIPIALFLEYYRQPRREEIRWDELTEVVLESPKSGICFVYPDRDKPHKMCSLALKYDEAPLTNIAQASRFYARAKVHEGKIKRSDILGYIVLFVVAAIVFTAIAIAANQK
jgi:hypothetical protein